MSDGKPKILAIVFAFIMMTSVISTTDKPMRNASAVLVLNNSPADVVWSEDFNDGNISDWSIYGFLGPPPYTNPPGNFTAEDGVLRANGSEEIWSQACAKSSVAYGTWDFDVDVVDDYGHEIVIAFIMVNWTLENLAIDCYFIQIITGMYYEDPRPRLQAGKCYADENVRNRSIVWYDDYLYEDMLGWKHFTITRQDNGQVYVYMNGTLATSWKDNQHTTCNEFTFASGPGPAIDNIVVDSNITYDAAPPEWVNQPTDQFAIQSQSFRYDLDAEDFSGLGTWAINDTTNFAVDSNGVITNATTLTPGFYGLNVSVSDTLGFTRAAVFKVTVTSEPTAVPPFTPLLVVGITAIVLIVLVIIFKKKRG